jgi:hypothetical protein
VYTLSRQTYQSTYRFNMTTFEQIQPTILASLGLEGAKGCGCSYATEYEWNHHPDHPQTYLLWADFDPTAEGKDGVDGAYMFHCLKVLDTRFSTPVSDRLSYSLSRVQISKWYFDKTYGTIDSKKFGWFKMGYNETPFFRTRMEQLLSS